MHCPPTHAPAAIASLAALALLLSGCATPSDDPTVQGTASVADHIHAFELSPSDGRLLLATHEGIYSMNLDSATEATLEGPLGGFDFDPMGFTIDDGAAYASGHPGPTTPKELAGPNLGLIRSDDGGLSWDTISLGSITDFHALTVSRSEEGKPATIYGLDSATGTVRSSSDGGVTWQEGAALEARTILADPNGTGVLYATTADGLALSSDDGKTFAVDPAAPNLFLIVRGPADGLAGVAIDGTLWTKTRTGAWTSGGSVAGTPQALIVADSRLFVADDRGVAYTDDLGGSWTVLKMTG